MHVAAIPLLVLSAIAGSDPKTDKPLATVDEKADRVSVRAFEQDQKKPRVYTGLAGLSEKTLEDVKRAVRMYNVDTQVIKSLRRELEVFRKELAASDTTEIADNRQQAVDNMEEVLRLCEESIRKEPGRLHKRLLELGLKEVPHPPAKKAPAKRD